MHVFLVCKLRQLGCAAGWFIHIMSTTVVDSSIGRAFLAQSSVGRPMTKRTSCDVFAQARLSRSAFAPPTALYQGLRRTLIVL